MPQTLSTWMLLGAADRKVLILATPLLLLWVVVLSAVPDPRPLSAPGWSVTFASSAFGLSEPYARAVATIAFRGAGLALVGVLAALIAASFRPLPALPVAFVGALLLAVLSQRINYGYTPTGGQLTLAALSVTFGILAGLALRRSVAALVAMLLLGAALYAWGASTGISADLNEAARATGLYILDNADSIPSGDEGFAKLIQLAFEFAADNSHGTSPVRPNKAAILALGVILGDERVASVAKRQNVSGRIAEFEAIRRRVTLGGRDDLARHFCVSAALTVLADRQRSNLVGIGKEMMDAAPGGSGFSFVDLTADYAGTAFARAATRNAESAENMQLRLREGVRIADYFPEIQGLPEGLSRDEFQDKYGGLGGQETKRLIAEIRRRLAACPGLDGGR